MSDIKLEDYEPIKLAALNNRELISKIRSLITTIESQQEKLDLQTEPVSEIIEFLTEGLAQKDALIESLREEIISQRNMFHENAYRLEKLSEDAYIRELQTLIDSQHAHYMAQIESQKEEIKRLSTCQDCGGTGTNELCHDPYYVVPCICTVDWLSENMELRKQIESLKAITELAVKGLEKVKLIYTSWNSDTASKDMYLSVLQSIATIERLQNE